MATQRTRQTHQQRVERIATEAAHKIAAESPVAEEVVVTVEELPPTTDASATGSAGQLGKSIDVIGPTSLTRYMETMAALAEANVEFTQRVFDAQLRFATRMADAVVPRSR